ncbi:MAG: hypothetical protein H6907_20040 [Hyphomicrobiales bacterium]|nr:hypothetical protein [Hyphomicrobiales bacterium]MCP5374031.1 hypothetical protein [Hyphomicrobiales bacterium]
MVRRWRFLAALAVLMGVAAGAVPAGPVAAADTATARTPFPSDPWALPDWRTAPVAGRAMQAPPRPVLPATGAATVRTPFPENPWQPARRPSADPVPVATTRVTLPATGGTKGTPFPADPWGRGAVAAPAVSATPALAPGYVAGTATGAMPWKAPAGAMPWKAPAGAAPAPAQTAAAADGGDGRGWQFSDFWRKRWAIAGYLGLGTEGGIEDLPLFEADFNAAYIATIEGSLEFFNIYDWVAVEAAANLTKYFHDQDNTEGNLFLILRWLKFPWDRWVDTSFAVGEGISYATPVGSIEKRRSPTVTSNLLNYLMFEIEVTKPGAEHWSGFMRIHHRSGVFGLYNDVSKGSNFLVWGLRYRF